MDLKGWKKIKEDAKTCTLEHPKGHSMTIAISALPKIQREQLKRLEFSKGGRVDKMMSPDDALASGEGGKSSQGSSVREKDFKHAKDEAKGRAEFERKHIRPKMKGLADGGEVSQDEDLGKDIAPIPEPPPPPQQPAVIVNNISPQAPAPAPSPVPAPAASAPPQIPIPSAPMPPPPVQAPPPSGPLPQAVPKPLEEPNKNLFMSDKTTNPAEAADLEQRAIQEGAAIESEMAKGAAEAERQNIEGKKSLQQFMGQNLNELKEHADDTANAIKQGLIDPNAYMKNMGTGQKVGTAIGIFLGGLGTGFGGHNYALEFLNKQIDRDIEGQKARSEQQKNIFSAYRDLYHDEQIATNMTKIALDDITVHQINQRAKQLGTAQALKNAHDFSAQKALEKTELLVKTSGRLGALKTSGGFPKNQTQQPPPGGAPPAPKKMPKGTEEKPQAGVYRILIPKAIERFDGLKYTPKFEDKIDRIHQSFTQAQQAEKVLNGPNNDGVGGIHDLMMQMHQAQEKTGAYGHIKREGKEALGALPFIGGAAASATNIIPLTESEKKYNGVMATLATDLATALNGLMTPSDIHSIVKDNAPVYGDNDKDVTAKEQRIVNMILKAVRTTDLEDSGLLRKK